MNRRVSSDIEVKISPEGKRWYRKISDPADVEIDININNLRERAFLERPLVKYSGSYHARSVPGFKVLRWRMQGALGSHAIWVSDQNFDDPRFVESTRLLVIDEYKKKFGDVDCEPVLTYHDVPKGKNEFMEWLNEYCSC